jgi:type IV secretory pathway protease TraF
MRKKVRSVPMPNPALKVNKVRSVPGGVYAVERFDEYFVESRRDNVEEWS